MSNFKVTALVFCDDIRKEVSNKDILIGVYSGDIVVGAFPAPLNLAFWIELLPQKTGQFRIEFRLSLKGKDAPLNVTYDINVSALGKFALSTPPVQVLAEGETEISFEMKDDDAWLLLGTKKVIAGSVATPFNVSNAPPPPS